MGVKRGDYSDMLYMEHHVSSKHPHMSIKDRAAQFSPFAALNGHEEAIDETARLTDSFVELTEDEKKLLDNKMMQIVASCGSGPTVAITYFIPDELKEGGKYAVVKGQVLKVRRFEKTVEMKSGEIIAFNAIKDIEICE